MDETSKRRFERIVVFETDIYAEFQTRVSIFGFFNNRSDYVSRVSPTKCTKIKNAIPTMLTWTIFEMFTFQRTRTRDIFVRHNYCIRFSRHKLFCCISTGIKSITHKRKKIYDNLWYALWMRWEKKRNFINQ